MNTPHTDSLLRDLNMRSPENGEYELCRFVHELPDSGAQSLLMEVRQALGKYRLACAKVEEARMSARMAYASVVRVALSEWDVKEVERAAQIAVARC